LVVLLVVLVVGAVSCWCCQLSVAVFRCMVMAVGAVGFRWPWSCLFVDSLVLPVALVPAVVGIGAGCPLQVALVLSVVGAVGCW
jgi:hypothetical protein